MLLARIIRTMLAGKALKSAGIVIVASYIVFMLALALIALVAMVGAV